MTDEHRLVKEIHGVSGATHSALYAPQPALAGCIRAYLSRSTEEAAALTPEERRNHFPPTSTCVIVWLIRGQDSRVPAPDDTQPTDHRSLPVVFSGPHTRPSVSHNSGEVQFFTLLIYPDALRALSGLEVMPHINGYSPFASLFDSNWQDMAHAVLTAPDDGARIRLIEAFLGPRWAAAQSATAKEPSALITRPYSTAMARAYRLAAWSSDVALRATVQGRGQSERQVDRRIKTWTGQTLRQLRGIGRLEEVLLAANPGALGAAPAWSTLAADNGFSDQPHLCRELRRFTGFSPDELKRNLNHESFWVYRIWT
ncbi:helix-turn-helix transcriptional regulator [Pseudomonas gingeri]|uniref:helix-turn-helix domain-containing protein n=1 Tax=Pseudomonas gingeri TaxID=117681 RepID=UPI0015A248AA|nr:AraC family transcriptional regulator [Pseudomonas gingeri]NWA24222.1 helix-turn-helix transcriptional regulator [Pseudomonas gingeri]